MAGLSGRPVADKSHHLSHEVFRWVRKNEFDPFTSYTRGAGDTLWNYLPSLQVRIILVDSRIGKDITLLNYSRERTAGSKVRHHIGGRVDGIMDGGRPSLRIARVGRLCCTVQTVGAPPL